MKQFKESTMSSESGNKIIEESAKKFKKWRISVRVINVAIYGWPTNKVKYSQKIEANDKFINMVNQFRVINSTMVFKIYIERFLNTYSKFKKFSLSFQF